MRAEFPAGTSRALPARGLRSARSRGAASPVGLFVRARRGAGLGARCHPATRDSCGWTGEISGWRCLGRRGVETANSRAQQLGESLYGRKARRFWRREKEVAVPVNRVSALADCHTRTDACHAHITSAISLDCKRASTYLGATSVSEHDSRTATRLETFVGARRCEARNAAERFISLLSCEAGRQREGTRVRTMKGIGKSLY